MYRILQMYQQDSVVAYSANYKQKLRTDISPHLEEAIAMMMMMMFS
jgi:hypothetical protein